MDREGEVWDAKWVIFDPSMTHISLKPKDLGWKLYGSLPYLTPTYPESFISFECSWAEIDFWGGGALKND